MLSLDVWGFLSDLKSVALIFDSLTVQYQLGSDFKVEHINVDALGGGSLSTL